MLCKKNASNNNSNRYLLIIEPGLLLSMKISWNIIRSIDRLIERQQSILIDRVEIDIPLRDNEMFFTRSTFHMLYEKFEFCHENGSQNKKKQLMLLIFNKFFH
ncbi:hypothetical protein DERP_012649 [Dermatophagoides pteronyssinus]|uniref:Uncharacterized protein n=1 Tax=Dermatophagoides pteronyssinus TaxID=6956 RepID=A0ABQ8IYJ4_DERPT|nr:hypothetical protein DERP_012649 [Dermatophagoides pteronyssinus]